MKKIFTLLWLSLAAFTFKATAQPTPVCNAEFSVQYLTNYTVKFNPVIANDSPYVLHFWNFGDGTPGSQQISPTHTYTLPGIYSVVHTIVRVTPNNVPVCTQTFTRQVNITAPCNLAVNFSWSSTVANPLTISFQNLSIPLANTDSIKWTFGDGTSVSGLQNDPNIANPTHIYAQTGNYNVCLRVKKNGNIASTVQCVRDLCRTLTVFEPCTLVVNFTAQADPANPARIKFTNTSTPINPTDSVRWTFGDGSSVSGLQSDTNIANPVHIYATAGNYAVCLRIKKNNNATTPVQCIREKCAQVVVTNPCNFPVNFSWRMDSLNARKIYFTNLSIPPVSGAIAVWNFGDGSSATSWNAMHEYAQPGRYLVCLRVYLPTSNCVRETCDTIFITNPPPPCPQLSKYQYQVFPNDIQKYKFTPDYMNAALQYTWTFGDGTGSHDPIAVHRYAQPGVYVACLTVWRGPECASTTCREIKVLPQINCDTAHTWYTYQRNQNIPNNVQFTANATIPIIDQVWYITRVSGTVTIPPVILHQNNPLYTFQDTGFFRVCVKATLQGGCIKEYCNYIRIDQVSSACELQAFPNPAFAVVNVNLYLTQPELILATVYNNVNMAVLTQTQQGNTGNNLITINVSNLAAGLYTIRLVYANRVCYARFQKL